MATTFKHSGDLGDLVYALPTIKGLGGGILYLSTQHESDMQSLRRIGFESSRFPTGSLKYDGSKAGLTKTSAECIIPFLREQPYLTDVRIWEGQPIDFNLNLWRTSFTNFRVEPIAVSVAKYFGAPLEVLKAPWLLPTTSPSTPISRVIFARSLRYQNSAFPWKQLLSKHSGDAAFVGTQEEHASFVRDVGEVPYHATKDIKALAEAISTSTLFIGNQSLPYAIAEGYKIDSIQETSPTTPNCIYPRPNAQYFIEGRLAAIRRIRTRFPISRLKLFAWYHLNKTRSHLLNRTSE